MLRPDFRDFLGALDAEQLDWKQGFEPVIKYFSFTKTLTGKYYIGRLQKDNDGTKIAVT